MKARHAADADVYDSTPEFCSAVSLLAAIEGAVGQPGHLETLPFLGMARAELVDFGQRRPAQLLSLDIDDVGAALRELEGQITLLLHHSQDLSYSLRLHAARDYVRRGIRATI